MDPSEQPTIWPPAPTVAPPEAEQPKPFKLRLPVPEWGRNWYNSTISFLTAWYIMRGFCEIDNYLARIGVRSPLRVPQGLLPVG